MNIIPQAPNLSIPTVLNPHTETLRRENNQREVITQPAAPHQSTAEKGVASDKERGRTPAQNNENIDFASLKEKAELANNAVAEQNKEQDSQQGRQQNSQQNSESSDSEANPNAEQEASRERAKEYQQAQEINELKARDQEVRSHERAHSAVGGAFTGSPNYSFEAGPDGKKYAVEGDVSVDLSTVEGDPRATIAKMQKVHAAALAPANPSVQDTRIAASAAQIILQAQSALLAEQGNEFVSENSADPVYINPNSVLDEDGQTSEELTSNEQSFDALIKQTLESQEKVAPARSEEVIQRASRIASFYSNITQAYEKPATYQFELTA